MARSSLRSELLFNLSFLAAAALMLALWTASVLPWSTSGIGRAQGFFVALIVVDVLVFLLLANHLVKRLVLRPLNETVEVAEAIAGGAYHRRAPEGSTREMAALSRSLNRLTDELLQNQERLAENIRSLDETNRILNETQRELIQVEKMASIGRLAAGIAHEIGNPLGAVVGYASVLRRRGVDAGLVDGIERESRRIDQIVRGLLDYARPGTAPRELVDVNASVQRVIALLRAQGRLAEVDLVTELEPDLPAIVAVPHRLDQIFINLFTNADAAMKGRGRLAVHTRAEVYHPDRPLPVRRADDPPGIDYSHLRRLRHGAIHDPRNLEPDLPVVRVVVADSGPGIPEDHLDNVFDPFFTTKAPGEGTGLGLAIVAATVAEAGGRIEVSSLEGSGATFHLIFPIPVQAS